MTTTFSKLRGATPLLAALALGAALLAGCSSTSLDPAGAPVEDRNVGGTAGTGTGSGSGSASGSGTGGQSRVTPVDLAPSGGAATSLSQRTVYFEFDSYAIKDEYRGIVDRYGRALAADRKKRVQVEGHTDDRGGREYNLALGQKRAEAVTRALTLLGATDAQVEAVSFGKERPAATGSDEAAFAKNRRAELNER